MNPTEIILLQTNFTSRQGKYLVETLKLKNLNVTAKEISPYQVESIVGEIEKYICICQVKSTPLWVKKIRSQRLNSLVANSRSILLLLHLF